MQGQLLHCDFFLQSSEQESFHRCCFQHSRWNQKHLQKENWCLHHQYHISVTWIKFWFNEKYSTLKNTYKCKASWPIRNNAILRYQIQQYRYFIKTSVSKWYRKRRKENSTEKFLYSKCSGYCVSDWPSSFGQRHRMWVTPRYCNVWRDLAAKAPPTNKLFVTQEGRSVSAAWEIKSILSRRCSSLPCNSQN